MGVSREEFLDILFFASHLAKVDGSFDMTERKALIDVAKAVDITADEMEKTKAKVSLESSIRDLKSAAAKRLLVDILLLVAGADGTLSKDENDFILRVIKRVGLEPDQFPYFQPSVDTDTTEVKNRIDLALSDIKG